MAAGVCDKQQHNPQTKDTRMYHIHSTPLPHTPPLARRRRASYSGRCGGGGHWPPVGWDCALIGIEFTIPLNGSDSLYHLEKWMCVPEYRTGRTKMLQVTSLVILPVTSASNGKQAIFPPSPWHTSMSLQRVPILPGATPSSLRSPFSSPAQSTDASTLDSAKWACGRRGTPVGLVPGSSCASALGVAFGGANRAQ